MGTNTDFRVDIIQLIYSIFTIEGILETIALNIMLSDSFFHFLAMSVG